MSTESSRHLGQKLKQVRKLSGLTQDQVGAAIGMSAVGSSSYVSRLEQGKIPKVALVSVVRYLQACKVPVGRFMLELAQSGAFGEAEAEDVRESVTGFTSQKPRGETCDAEARRAKSKLIHEKRREREAQDADIVASLWIEVLTAMQPLLPPDPTRFMAHYLEVVRSFHRAWKLTTRGARDQNATQAVQAAFDRIEQNAMERLVPAAVRKMREVVFARLMERTLRGGIT